ncbi:ejaculatory bulb-specific protein 3 [Diachasma alloeum]|uniref:Chemosensory protein 2 n=1 Tax=Diachasma alloeum TaxID=454923 RepID=A0A4E0RK55_9HYME|nr:ejaculatory bulb-specific protein 3 [Diachasma alloeum]THK33132.1 chemosensory protein 2 [Diachasma alloeum]
MLRGAVVIALVFLSAVIAEEKYSEKYDYVDVDGILANDKQRESYYKCFAGIGPCKTAAARFFRDTLPEAIVTRCKKCTARQSVNFDKISDWYTTNEPEKYQIIVAKAVRDIMAKSA